MAEPGEHRNRVFRFSWVGLILVVLGILFLLENLGVVSAGIWGIIWRFWPVLIILIGLNILWGRRHPGAMLAITAVLLVAVVIAGVLIQRNQGTGMTSFSYPLQAVERSDVTVEFGAGDVVLGSLPADSLNLVEGAGSQRVSSDLRTSGSSAILRLSTQSNFPFAGSAFRLEANLTQRIPIELTIKSGASRNNLDLTQLKVTRLRVETGASDVDLKMPAAAGVVDASVKAGVADISISIPQGVAARITTSGGLSTFRVDTARFPRSDGYYQSADYSTATNRIDLRVDVGLATVDVR